MIETMPETRSAPNPVSSSWAGKRVAILCLPQPGGIAYYGALLANALSRYGEVLIVITEEMKNFSFEKNLKVACVRKRSVLALPHPRAYREILRHIREFDPHVVHDTAG